MYVCIWLFSFIFLKFVMLLLAVVVCFHCCRVLYGINIPESIIHYSITDSYLNFHFSAIMNVPYMHTFICLSVPMCTYFIGYEWHWWSLQYMYIKLVCIYIYFIHISVCMCTYYQYVYILGWLRSSFGFFVRFYGKIQVCFLTNPTYIFMYFLPFYEKFNIFTLIINTQIFGFVSVIFFTICPAFKTSYPLFELFPPFHFIPSNLLEVIHTVLFILLVAWKFWHAYLTQ